MRLNRAIKHPRVIECQFFSFMPPICSAKVATNTAASSLSALQSEDGAFPGAACVKLQVDCLRVRVKIELDHGPISAPSPLRVKSGHVQCKRPCPLSARSGMTLRA